MRDRFLEIQIGDVAELEHTIKKDDIEKFVDLTGDDNKLHCDSEYAKKTPFKKPVVHGMLSASFISTLIGTKLPGDGALWFSQSLEFLVPVREGDRILVKGEVVKKVERDRIIEIRTDVYNGARQKVVSGLAKVKVAEVLEDAHESVEGGPTSKKKLAVIVGASGGIGAATAKKFASNGYDLLLHYHSNEKKMIELKKELSALGINIKTIKGDLNDEKTISELAFASTRFGLSVGAVINVSTTRVVNVDWAQLDWVSVEEHLNINIKSSFLLAKYFLPVMATDKHGSFVFASSQAVEVPVQDWLPYITAKSALVGMAKSMAVDFAKFGVRVNLVSPGMTDTDLIADFSGQSRMLVEAKCPLHRIATPIDVANAIFFLCSEEASYLTGETIRVNGGMTMV